MKNKQKSLKDIDFVKELTMSELEQINGGTGKSFNSNDKSSTLPNGQSTPFSPFEEETDPVWTGKDSTREIGLG